VAEKACRMCGEAYKNQVVAEQYGPWPDCSCIEMRDGLLGPIAAGFLVDDGRAPEATSSIHWLSVMTLDFAEAIVAEAKRRDGEG
jgi:hypothetical protein